MRFAEMAPHILPATISSFRFLSASLCSRICHACVFSTVSYIRTKWAGNIRQKADVVHTRRLTLLHCSKAICPLQTNGGLRPRRRTDVNASYSVPRDPRTLVLGRKVLVCTVLFQHCGQLSLGGDLRSFEAKFGKTGRTSSRENVT